MRTYKTPSEAYLETLQDVFYNYEYSSEPRGQHCREKLDYQFRVLFPDSSPIITRDIERNKVIALYTKKEFELYNSCSNQAADFAKASKFWDTIKNPDGTINSAYGYLIWERKSCGMPHYETGVMGADGISRGVPADQYAKCYRTPWEWAKQCLVSDKDTRQAVMHFSLPEHKWLGNKDQTCTKDATWHIRDNKLNLSVSMRSNDMVLGLVYDLPWFCSLLDKMLEELKPTYPDLTKGSYTHKVDSLHVYDKNEAIVLAMLGK